MERTGFSGSNNSRGSWVSRFPGSRRFAPVADIETLSVPPEMLVRRLLDFGSRRLYIMLALGLVFAALPVAAQPLPYTGVNLAGGEFYDPVKIHDPVYGRNFTYPTAAEFEYFAGKGMNVFRLPFLWETLQPVAKQPFRAVGIARLKARVKLATGRSLV